MRIITSLACSEELRACVGENGKSYVREDYTIEKKAEGYTRFYESTCRNAALDMGRDTLPTVVTCQEFIVYHKSRITNIIADFGSKRSTYYEENYANKSGRNYLRRLRHQLIEERLPQAKSLENVLDAGCGPAILYKELLAQSAKYYALDMVQSNLDEIKNAIHTQSLELICDDLDQFKWKECFFDVIVCSGAIEYTSYPKRNLVKLLSFLKPGGTLVCSFPNVLSPYRIWSEYVYRYAWKLKNKARRKVYYTYPRKLFSHASICRLLRGTQAVESIDTRYFGQKLLLQPLDNLLGNLDFRIERLLERHPLWLIDRFCIEFLITVTKR